MKLKIITVVLLSMALGSCFASRQMGKTRLEQVVFGVGGGVTGIVTSYTLKSDGSLYKGDEFLKKIAKKDVKNMFKKLSDIADYKYSKPANMYQFLELRTANSNNKIVWGLGDKGVDNHIFVIYDELKKFIE